MSRPLSIVADQQISFATEAFSRFGDVTLVDGRSIDWQRIKKADVLLVRSITRVDETLLKDTPVRFVGSATSGIDHIDLNYLESAGIRFIHAPGSNARSVAEYVLSSLFVLAEQQVFSLSDKTMGIIGCGQVGSRVKRFMDALGVRCLLNDPPLAQQSDNQAWSNLEQTLSADIISLHVPLVVDGDFPTANLVNKNFLSRLKSDVIFINTSRGEVVNEMDLMEFKRSHPDSKLILDVWQNEPEIDLELLQQASISTPHIAGYSFDGKLKATRMLSDALCDFTNTEKQSLDIQFPDQENGIIDLVANDDMVQLAVLQSYDVRSDAIALRDMLNLTEDKRIGYFDNLRKNYPVRREFKNWTIQSKNISGHTRQQLQQLGFNLEVA